LSVRMGFLKVRLRFFCLVAWVLAGVGCGVDPRGQFEGEVRGMIEVAREGKYGELEEVMSEGLKGKFRTEKSGQLIFCGMCLNLKEVTPRQRLEG
jgi:hypothetical protein